MTTKKTYCHRNKCKGTICHILAVFAFVGTVVSTPLAIAESDHCAAWSIIGTAIMEGRQKGTPINEMIKTAGTNEFGEYLVVEAYKEPKYTTAKMQKETVTEFGNRAYLECLKTQSDKSKTTP